jgi:hypothetical protein
LRERGKYIEIAIEADGGRDLNLQRKRESVKERSG